MGSFDLYKTVKENFMKIAGFGKVAAALAVVLVSVALLSCGKGKKADKTKVSAQETKDGEKEEVVEIQIVDTKDANAASDFIYETTVDGSAVVIQKYIGSRGNVIVPEEIEGYKVTTIGESSFSGVKNIASVVLPSSVTTIRASAFNGSSLKEVTLPSSVTTIEASAFKDTYVVYGNGAFSSCNSWGTMTVALRKKLNESGYKGNYYEKDISCCKNAK